MKAACSSILLACVAGLVLSGCREPNSTIVSLGAASAEGGTEASGYLASDLCNIESIDGKLIDTSDFSVAGSASIRVRGWLAAEKGTAISGPKLMLAGKDKSIVGERPIELSVPRQDVAQVYKSRGVGDMTGFEVDLPLKDLPAGRYHLYLGHRSGNQLFACDNGRHIHIGE